MPYFCRKLGKMSKNLSSTAVVIGALRVKTDQDVCALTLCMLANFECFLSSVIFFSIFNFLNLSSECQTAWTHTVELDLGTNCLPMLSADIKSQLAGKSLKEKICIECEHFQRAFKLRKFITSDPSIKTFLPNIEFQTFYFKPNYLFSFIFKAK